MKFPMSLLLASALLLTGCGPKEVEEKVDESVGPPPVKAMLEGVAETGELGSGAMEIRESLSKVDPAKQEELKKDMDELEKMTNPEQIKAKAKAMANKL